MKKIVRLTESDLIRLVKRVINEQQSMDPINTAGQKTSSTQLNDITQYIDKTGNSGCGMPFRLIKGKITSKVQDIKFTENNGRLYIGYKIPENKTQPSLYIPYQGGYINNCSIGETQATPGFGKSDLFKKLISNPGMPLEVTYSV